MKHQWVAYAIVAVLSIGAGVAIAGLPNNVPVDPTITAPSTTAPAPPSTLPPPTTSPPTSAPDTTAAPETTTPVATPPTEPGDGDVTTTTDPSAPTSTDGGVVVPSVTTTTAVPGLPERSELEVAVANGAEVPGIAQRTADSLQAIGYVDVQALDGPVPADATTVYYTEGYRPAAERLAVDLGLSPDAVGPIVGAPPVDGLLFVQLLAYLGRDRA